MSERPLTVNTEVGLLSTLGPKIVGEFLFLKGSQGVHVVVDNPNHGSLELMAAELKTGTVRRLWPGKRVKLVVHRDDYLKSYESSHGGNFNKVGKIYPAIRLTESERQSPPKIK